MVNPAGVKNMICIECPKGCSLTVDIEDRKVSGVRGARCPKGLGYAVAELENPSRILTATVLSDGLDIKLVPVRTDRPIPKKELFRAMEEIGRMRLVRPVEAGGVVAENFLGLGVNLIATRPAK
jgi:CxxC motif-containing protein